MIKEPQPCPFCGNSAIVIERDGGSAYRVKCRNIMECGAMSEWFDSEAEALAAWNRRTTSRADKVIRTVPGHDDLSKEDQEQISEFIEWVLNRHPLKKGDTENGM